MEGKHLTQKEILKKTGISHNFFKKNWDILEKEGFFIKKGRKTFFDEKIISFLLKMKEKEKEEKRKNRQEYLTAKELLQKIGKSFPFLDKKKKMIKDKGLIKEIGGAIFYHKEAIKLLSSIPDQRGKTKPILSDSRIIEKLKDGCRLENTGSGWYLIEPYMAYRSRRAFKIPDEKIENMKEKGILSYNTALAKIAKLNNKIASGKNTNHKTP